jgi:hypothetical protein
LIGLSEHSLIGWEKRNHFETLGFASTQDLQRNQTSNNNSITSTNGEQYEPWSTEIIEFLKKQNKTENMTPNYKLDINDKGD